MEVNKLVFAEFEYFDKTEHHNVLSLFVTFPKMLHVADRRLGDSTTTDGKPGYYK